MIENPLIHIVHCIDTEGPLDEDLSATFGRLKSIFDIDLPPSIDNLIAIQNKKINFNGLENSIAKCFDPRLLKYNKNWSEISMMLDVAMSTEFRREMVDDFDRGWIYSWHCMDHMGFSDNPRHKDIGYGNVFRFYKSKIEETKSKCDEINWHFHPLSITRNPLHAATSYLNSIDILLNIICRRIIEDEWFPVVNRPGFHSERPDSHLFLEQWIPFDYANQFYETDDNQPDLSNGRFGNWVNSPKTWRGYHPDFFDYQSIGSCRRMIFRCLNIGTRLRQLNYSHLKEAYYEAKKMGDAIVAFADHDYRDIVPDVNYLRELLRKLKFEFPDVRIKFSGAEEAATSLSMKNSIVDLELKLSLNENKLIVEVDRGEIFGPQPFLSIKTKDGSYFHDNFDFKIPGRVWTYIFDTQTIELDSVSVIGVGSAGKYGKFSVKIIKL
jgi:hypothetical protein